jgi:AcrR family transcriptional regulator
VSQAVRSRLTAGERQEQIVTAALEAFADGGYRATTTDDIARRVGVSQPYVIRLFGTKQALFVAAVERACDRIETVFREAAARRPDVDELGHSFFGVLSERELLMMLLHAYAASGDPMIGPVVRARFGAIYGLVRELTGADAETSFTFLATGMLLTVMSAMEVVAPDGTGTEDWAEELLAALRDRRLFDTA